MNTNYTIACLTVLVSSAAGLMNDVVINELPEVRN